MRSRTTPWKQELQEQRLSYFLLWIEAENKEKKRRVEALQRRSSHRNQNQISGPGILWERSFGKGRGGGSGSAKPVASERAKKATAFFFLSPLARVLRDDGNEIEQKSGWMGWMADGGASTGTGRIEYPRERVRCHAAVLCCAVGHLLQYRARQGSTGLYRGVRRDTPSTQH